MARAALTCVSCLQPAIEAATVPILGHPEDKGTEVSPRAYLGVGDTVMNSDAGKPEIEDDTGQWDWVPVEPGGNSRRALGAIVLAGSCLTLGVLIGTLSAPIFQRTSVKLERTASNVPKNLAKPMSEPSLALGGPPETPTKPQEAAPKAPVVINEGSAKLAIEQPGARDVGQAEAAVKKVEDQPPKPQDVASKGSADHEAMRPRANLKREDLGEKASAMPAKPRTVERSFKDYRDLRNYVLGK